MLTVSPIIDHVHPDKRNYVILNNKVSVYIDEIKIGS